MERKNRTVRPLGPEDVEDYLTIYLMSYPAFKDIGVEGRAYKHGVVLDSMAADKGIHFVGLFEDDTLIAAMKLIDFNMNIFGEMQKATGLMALGVHPLHKKKGAALEMVRYFEKYTMESGAVIALLLPFRMDFYRSMGYGFESRLYEYRLSTAKLPRYEDMSAMRFLEEEDFEEVLACHRHYVRKNHGMLDKFADEINDMRGDSAVRRVGYFRDGRMTGYVAYHYVCRSEVNYTLNRIEADELIYDGPEELRALLGFLRLQADQDQEVVLRTGEEDFFHMFDDPEDTSGYYVPFGCLETNVSTINVMHKILEPVRFVQATSYRSFPADDLMVCFETFDEMREKRERLLISFKDGRWSPGEGANPDVTVRCRASDMASIFMGSAEVAALARLGVIEISDPSCTARLDSLFHVAQRPFSNTDF
jgi:predicted acetyltransferase